MSGATAKVTVVGSINADMRVDVERFPGPGETLAGGEATLTPGGKGANQALAAARCGVQVAMVGAVGKDPTAETALSLLSEGVGLDGVVRRDVLTGTAVVMVADSGENSIIVIAAANGTVDAQTVRAQAERIQDADVVVCQGEIPPDGIAEAARGAKRFVFNLAPVVDVDPEVIRMADPLVVNEHEAALVALALGSTTSRLEDDPDAALRELLNLGCRSVVITLGSSGYILSLIHI